MDDYREQLKAIRSKVRGAGPSEPPTSGFGFASAILPELGKVDSYDEERGFGHISSGHSWFFHVSGHLFGSNNPTAKQLVGMPVLFITGSTPRDSAARVRAVKWCLLNELALEADQIPDTQSQVDDYRAEWFQSQTLETLLKLLTAEWYAELWGEEKPPRNLHDEVFRRALIDAFNGSSSQQLCSLDLHAIFARSPFEFTRHWLLRDEHLTCGHLLNHLSPEQLVAFGVPRLEWFSEAGEAQKGPLIAWAMLSNLSSSARRDWLALVGGRESWASDLAETLAASRWLDQSARERWEHDVLASAIGGSQTATPNPKAGPAMEKHWFDLLPRPKQLEFLSKSELKDDSLVEFLRSRNDVELIADLVAKQTLSIDLETDGDEIWEIGTATSDGEELLLEQRHAAKCDKALREVARRVSEARLVVGHNLLSWDWPILSAKLRQQQEPLIWDTLLVQILLRPWAASLALGGSHRAHEDAAQALALFREQIVALPPAVGLAILSGHIRNSSELIASLTKALEEQEWTLPVPPAWVSKAKRKVTSDQILLVPRTQLPALNWCPEAVVVAASDADALPVDKYEITPDSLARGCSLKVRDAPHWQALVHIINKAARHRVRVRLDMLPLWLREQVHFDSELRTALERPSACNAQLAAAPFPDSGDWCSPENSKRYVCLAPPPPRVIVRRRLLSTRDTERLVQEGSAKESCRITPANPAPFKRYQQSSSQATWLLLDKTLACLPEPNGPWRSFSALPTSELGFDSVLDSVPKPAMLPRLISRSASVLHPGAEDQRAYWKEVLRCLATIKSHFGPDQVPLLLVSSSSSHELIVRLQHALAEIGLGEVYPDHQSRFEKLRRARQAGHCLLDSIGNWPAWRRLLEQGGVGVCPVLDAVPLEEWYAASPEISEVATEEYDRDELDADDDWADDAAEEEGDQEKDLDCSLVANNTSPVLVADVPRGRLLEFAPQLTSMWLDRWLWEEGLSDHPIPPIVLDGRLASRQRSLRAIMEAYPPPEFQFGVDELERLDAALSSFRIERAEAPQDYAAMQEFLVQHWNRGRSSEDRNYIANFRAETQQPAMEAIRRRDTDVVVTLPTGEGKSVLFQVPALCRGLRSRRLTLVISPLRALMRDQVESLGELGFRDSVDYLCADRSYHETEDAFQGLLDHRIVLLYVAPERFRNARFLDALDKRVESDGGLEYIVVDEAHCVSQWGYEFRPDYFHAITVLQRRYRGASVADPAPVILLSATITSSNRIHLENLTGPKEGNEAKRQFPFLVAPDKFFNPIRSHISITPHKVGGSISTSPRDHWPIEPRLAEIASVLAEAAENFEKTGQHSAVIVFVTRRDHAERIASCIREAQLGRADYFHAGLDASTRQDVYERFRSGQLDVLVATKAFGMGMDIPHIHWAIHLSPPSYLEDYLQEVGRIGRGAAERQKAGLDLMTAILLFSEDDFESIRSRRAGDTVGFRQVADWYDIIRTAAKSLEGREVAIVPEAGFNPPVRPGARRAAANRLRIALYWMERIGRVTLEAMAPGLLPVTLNGRRVRELVKTESGPIAEVAASIAALLDPKIHEQQTGLVRSVAQGEQQKEATGGWLGNVLRGLGEIVGLVFGGGPSMAVQSRDVTTQQAKPPMSEPKQAAGEVEAVLNIATIWRETGLATADEVLGAVAELEKLGALRLERSISFSRRPLAESGPEVVAALYDALGRGLDELIGQLERHGPCTIDFEDLAQRIGASSLPTEYASGFHGALERSLPYLLRQVGARVRQEVSSDGMTELQIELVRSSGRAARARARTILATSRQLWPVFRRQLDEGKREIPITTLISGVSAALPGRKFREKELRRATTLLSKLGLVSMSEPVVPMSYVLSLSGPNTGLSEDEDMEAWQELSSINRLADLRCQAMEIFAHLPIDAQSAFISEYFAKETPDEMEAFLEAQLGEMEEIAEGADSSFVAKAREALRAKAVESFFNIYKHEPEEPNQWRAISHPFNSHLLVNAGPGSGKTAVLLARVAHLIRIQQLRPEEILVLAFNRAVVFEIRARIRELFSRLGYGAYVRRLKANTFHAFAMKHMASRDGTEDPEEGMKILLREFAERLETEPGFRSEVASEFRAIVVDEFQDANEDIYRILMQISEAAGPRAGLMVIGDDDQDILTWTRDPPASSNAYFDRFREDFSLGQDQQLVLRVNFRSGQEIVDHSQDFLAERLVGLDGEAGRLKHTRLTPADAAPCARVAELPLANRSWETVLRDAHDKLSSLAGMEGSESIAILCRTNAEAASAYIYLRDAWPGLSVQSSSKSRAARLRHLGTFLDTLKQEVQESGNRPLDDELREKTLGAYRSSSIPEVKEQSANLINPEQLWNLCKSIHSYPYLSSLIDLIEDLDLDELMLLLGTRDEQRSFGVVSTIHKVKGLEFDRVLILPSTSRFCAEDGQSITSAAAAEARLMYVAMTRAKRSLRYYIGPREEGWIVGRPVMGSLNSGRMLQGTPKEVSLGWAWGRNTFNRNPDECQAYIERQVAVGDRLEIGGVGTGKGKALLHRGKNGIARQIGFLSKRSGAAGPNHDLIVSSVIRYPVDLETETDSHELADCIRNRGWGYVIVPAGVLR